MNLMDRVRTGAEWLAARGVTDRVVLFTTLSIAAGITLGHVAARQRAEYEESVRAARLHRADELNRLHARVLEQNRALAEVRAALARTEQANAERTRTADSLAAEILRREQEAGKTKQNLDKATADAIAAIQKEREKERAESLKTQQAMLELQVRLDQAARQWEERIRALEESRSDLANRLSNEARETQEWKNRYEALLREAGRPAPAPKPAEAKRPEDSSALLHGDLEQEPATDGTWTQVGLYFDELTWGAPGPERVRGDRSTYGGRLAEDFSIAGRCFRNVALDLTVGADQRVRAGRRTIRGRIVPNGRVGMGEGLADATVGALSDLVTLGAWNPVAKKSKGTGVPVLGAVYTILRGSLSTAGGALNATEGIFRGTMKVAVEAPLDATLGAWEPGARGVSGTSNVLQGTFAFAKSSAPGGAGWLDTHLPDWNRLRRGDPRGLPIVANLFNGDRTVNYEPEVLVSDPERFLAATDDNATKTPVRKILETVGF